MQSVQGLLLIGVALFLLWIGITGRFDKVIEALGIIRGAQPNARVPQPGDADFIGPLKP